LDKCPAHDKRYSYREPPHELTSGFLAAKKPDPCRTKTEYRTDTTCDPGSLRPEHGARNEVLVDCAKAAVIDFVGSAGASSDPDFCDWRELQGKFEPPGPSGYGRGLNRRSLPRARKTLYCSRHLPIGGVAVEFGINRIRDVAVVLSGGTARPATSSNGQLLRRHVGHGVLAVAAELFRVYLLSWLLRTWFRLVCVLSV
jgi:hypothetical protein